MMHRIRRLLPLAGALALGACSSDRPEALAPTAPALSAKVAGVSVDGRYIVVANGSGFASDFLSRVTQLGGAVESVHQQAGIAVVSHLSATAAGQLASVAGVADVEPDAVVTLDAPLAAAEADASAVEDPSINSQANPTIAARYAWQWNMRAIGANNAWAAGKLGSAGVTVAILDTGIDYDALDLNGLVDLSRSTSFVASDDAVSTTYFPSRNRISDYNGHGTNVATQVSSKAVALAGVTSKTTLIGVKVLGASGSGSFSGVLNGVLWAADHGADVANMSLGSGFAKTANGRVLSLINRVFNYASQQGMLIVVAAGNSAANLDANGNEVVTYCDMPQVVCVSAVGPATATGAVDTPSFYTNFGRSAISVAAPGGNAQPVGTSYALSAWPWGNDIASWVWSLCSKTRIIGYTPTGAPVLTSCTAGNRLLGEIGTSQASPHVAGLAALLVAEKGHGVPQQIKAAILQSADDAGQPGVDPYFGKGRINVAKALGL
jgi:hypothetical protein